MFQDIEKINLKFMHNYKPEGFFIPTQSYLNYAPVSQPEIQQLYKVAFEREPQVCYIQIGTKWLIENSNNKLYISDFTNIRPTVFFIHYIKTDQDKRFFLYNNSNFGNPTIKYVQFEIINNIVISAKYVPTRSLATKFIYKNNLTNYKNYQEEKTFY